MMDNPNITMEEYIRLEEEKARRHGKVYNWETTKYGKIWYDEDVHDLRSIETEFPAIVFNDKLSSEKTLSREPTANFEMRLGKIYMREDVDGVQGCSGTGFGKVVLDLNTAGALQFQLGEADLQQGRSERLLEKELFSGGFSGYTPFLYSYQGSDAEIMPQALRLPGPERQPDAATGTLEIVEGALDVVEGDQVVLAPVQAPQPPPAARAISQRLARLEEDVHMIQDLAAKKSTKLVKYRSSGILCVIISRKACILEIVRRNMKITVLTSYTPYPSRKIRRICACTSQKTTKEQDPIRCLRKKYRLILKNDMPPRDK
ncbi:hypothetical protein Tco_0053433 [Tanacetum coccineum]